MSFKRARAAFINALTNAPERCRAVRISRPVARSGGVSTCFVACRARLGIDAARARALVGNSASDWMMSLGFAFLGRSRVYGHELCRVSCDFPVGAESWLLIRFTRFAVRPAILLRNCAMTFAKAA